MRDAQNCNRFPNMVSIRQLITLQHGPIDVFNNFHPTNQLFEVKLPLQKVTTDISSVLNGYQEIRKT